MFVCICNAYRSSDIIAAARAGCEDAEELYHDLGGGPVCRQCLDTAQALIDQERVTAGALG